MYTNSSIWSLNRFLFSTSVPSWSMPRLLKITMISTSFSLPICTCLLRKPIMALPMRACTRRVNESTPITLELANLAFALTQAARTSFLVALTSLWKLQITSSCCHTLQMASRISLRKPSIELISLASTWILFSLTSHCKVVIDLYTCVIASSMTLPSPAKASTLAHNANFAPILSWLRAMFWQFLHILSKLGWQGTTMRLLQTFAACLANVALEVARPIPMCGFQIFAYFCNSPH